MSHYRDVKKKKKKRTEIGQHETQKTLLVLGGVIDTKLRELERHWKRVSLMKGTRLLPANFLTLQTWVFSSLNSKCVLWDKLKESAQ